MEERAPDIEGYRILRKIGAGGIGVVYLAERSAPPPAQVALKLLHERTTFRADDVRRLLREARVGQSLRHAHILPVLAIEHWRGQPVLVMDFVPGVTLARWKTDEGERHAALAEKLLVLASIADALAYAHAQGVLHRDVKPGNILVREDGHPFLIDFGMARTLAVDSTITASGTVLGTPGYLPPEALSPDGRLDFRSDVYSLGVCAFEAAAGRLPFKADSLPGLLERIRNDEPPALRELAPHAPPALEPIVARALEKKPQDRYASATELGEELRRVALGLKPKTSRVSLWVNRELRGLKRARLRILAGIAAVSLVVLSAVGWGLASARDRLRRRDFEAALSAGYGHLDRGELELALSGFEAADAIVPGSPEPALARANAFAEFRMWQRAGESVQLAVERGYAFGGDAPSANDLFCRAIHSFSDKRDDAARAELEAALAKDSSEFRAAFLLEALYRRAKLVEPARTALTTCRDNLKAVDPRYAAISALLFELDGRYDEAVAALEARANSPGAPRWLQSHVGNVLLAGVQAGKGAPEWLDRGRRALERATGSEPGDGFAWSNLAVACYLANDFEGARTSAERALHADGLLEGANRILAVLAARDRDWEEALRRLSVIQTDAEANVAIDAFRADVLYNQGVELYGQQKNQEAIASLRQAVDLNPDHWGARFALASALRRAKDPSGAAVAFSQAIEHVERARAVAPDRLQPWCAESREELTRHEFDAHIGLLNAFAADTVSCRAKHPELLARASQSLGILRERLAVGLRLDPVSAFNLAEALIRGTAELQDEAMACELAEDYQLFARFSSATEARETLDQLKSACR